jgi:ribonuclease P protein subunit RPR2
VRRDKAEEKRIARQRMARLFALAEEQALQGNLERAARYAGLARRIGTRYTVRVAPEHRLASCRGCGAYLLPGKTARVRARGGKVAVTCLACGAVRRHGYTREQAQRRRSRAATRASARASAAARPRSGPRPSHDSSASSDATPPRTPHA